MTPRCVIWLTAMLCVASVLSTQPISAQTPVPGSLDSTFAAFATPPYRQVQFVLAQSNHLFVAGGFSSPGTNLVRLTADGAYDPTFVSTSGGPASVALQPDGNVLCGYWFRGVRRLLPNGSLDASFSFVPPDVHPRILPYYFWTTALAVQPDGRILMSGYRIYDSFGEDIRFYWAMPQVYRLLPDGSLDSTFTAFPATVRALAVLPDLRILVVGADLKLLHPNGTRDTNFVAGPFSPRIESSGLAAEDNTFETTLECFAIQPDGRILVGGSFTNVQGHTRWRVARVLPDGRLDLSFNPHAFIGDDFPESQVKALALQADGRILVGGVLRSDQWSGFRSIARLNSDGSLDSTFPPLIEGFDDDEDNLGIPSSIVIQDETRAVIGGSDLDAGALFRIHLGELRTGCDGFCITSFLVQPTSVTVSWRSEPRRTYYIDYKSTLTNPDWTPVSGGIIAQSTQTSWTGLRSPGSSAFYRVVRLGD
jgi:uncharacterized delta-60 repeat protein